MLDGWGSRNLNLIKEAKKAGQNHSAMKSAMKKTATGKAAKVGGKKKKKYFQFELFNSIILINKVMNDGEYSVRNVPPAHFPQAQKNVFD